MRTRDINIKFRHLQLHIPSYRTHFFFSGFLFFTIFLPFFLSSRSSSGPSLDSSSGPSLDSSSGPSLNSSSGPSLNSSPGPSLNSSPGPSLFPRSFSVLSILPPVLLCSPDPSLSSSPGPSLNSSPGPSFLRSFSLPSIFPSVFLSPLNFSSGPSLFPRSFSQFFLWSFSQFFPRSFSLPSILPSVLLSIEKNK
ncbi:unnamed protein product [Acanthosepion pharaonis]|uniref:Uncharacterized protein n=1 Tax=Acanthosepion pharaonis TaxID=158019 RepID=A0A812CHL0_ACAPH|nr:unnamed protein product [Sepia pharaonis]